MARKGAVNEVKNVNEIIFNLKNQNLLHNEERGTFIEDIPSQEDYFTFGTISDSIKTFSKLIKEVENMSLKNKVLLSGWISTAAKVFRRKKNMCGENLPGRFEDWRYKKCSTKK